MFSRKNKGFTLIELLVVIAIIGILASVVLASLNSARKKSRDARRIADIKQLQLAQELSFDAHRSYATTLASLVTDGFIASVPVDPLDTGSGGALCRAGSYCFNVAPATNPTLYHMGANLEEDTNVALESKKGCDSADNNPRCENWATAPTWSAGGFDGTGATIYDVVP